jgi:hypothetical protein
MNQESSKKLDKNEKQLNSPLHLLNEDDESEKTHLTDQSSQEQPSNKKDIPKTTENEWFGRKPPRPDPSPSKHSDISGTTHASGATIGSNNSSNNPNGLRRKKSLKQISMEEISQIVVPEDEYNPCCEVSSCCQKLVKFEVDSYAIIKILPISDFRKEILKRRYSDNIGNYQQIRDCTRFTYRMFQIIISIGSVIVPALLSVHMTDYVQSNNYDVQINLSVLILSIIVSICTHIIHIFRMDELYFNYAITVEKLKTLWYHFSSLSGPFVGSTHNESFTMFVNMMEEVIINQKFQEYIDSKSDKNKPKKEQELFYNDLQEYKNMINESNKVENNRVSENNIPENTTEEPFSRNPDNKTIEI